MSTFYTEYWSFLFWITVSGLVLVPPISFFLVKKLFKNNNRSNRISIFIMLIVFIFSVVSKLLNYSFVNLKIDFSSSLLIYLVYCILIFSTFSFFNKPWKTIIGIVGFTTMALGIIIGTIGSLGIAWAINDEIPLETVKIDDTFVYKVYSFGIAVSSSSGKEIRLFQKLSYAPFIEHRLLDLSLDNVKYRVDTINVVSKKEVGITSFKIFAGQTFVQEFQIKN